MPQTLHGAIYGKSARCEENVGFCVGFAEFFVPYRLRTIVRGNLANHTASETPSYKSSLKSLVCNRLCGHLCPRSARPFPPTHPFNEAKTTKDACFSRKNGKITIFARRRTRRCVIIANLLRCYRIRAWSCTSVYSLRPHPQCLAS